MQRRTFLLGSMAGIAFFSGRLGGAGRAASDDGFTHGVASGAPGEDSMLFWTRYVGKATTLRLEISRHPSMRNAETAGEAHPDPTRDHTARLTVHSLAPATTYYYRWSAGPKRTSETGRTRTLPGADAAVARVAVFTGTSMPGGWFNAYAHALQAVDFDFWLHLGDYIHHIPTAVVPARAIVPALPPRERKDFWARYRLYRQDPLLRQMHANFPIIALFRNSDLEDDPDGELTRAARAAFADWLPVPDASYQRYPIGRIATLCQLETGLFADPPVEEDAPTAAFFDSWVRGNRQILGREQEKWLLEDLETTRGANAPWRILAGARQMASIDTPAGFEALASPAGQPLARQAARFRAAGLPLFPDSWAGYPAARSRLLSMAQRFGANIVSLAPGGGNAWGANLAANGLPAGVEFSPAAVTSPGLEAFLQAPDAAAQSLEAGNPDLVFANLRQRGYLHLTLSAAAVQAEWRMTKPVTTLSSTLEGSVRAGVARNARRLVME